MQRISCLHELCNIFQERERNYIIRCVVVKLISALKRNCSMSDQNLQLLLQVGKVFTLFADDVNDERHFCFFESILIFLV